MQQRGHIITYRLFTPEKFACLVHKQVSVSQWTYEVLSNWYLYENDDMEQQDIQHDCGPSNHHPFLAFCSNARLIQSAPARFCVVIIFRAAQEASVEPVPRCARFIGTAGKVSMQMVQPFQLLIFGVYISGQDFSLSLQEKKKAGLSLRW